MLRLGALVLLLCAGTAHAQAPAPLPIMVVVQTMGRAAPELTAAAQQALVDQLTAMSGGRPVHALAAEDVLAQIAACSDDACHGAILASANAQTGVYLRLRARGRRPLEAAIELRDPVSGATRMPAAVAGELPLDAAQIPAAMQALTAQVQGAMPSPPPPPSTLLVTVNVDGASVSIDGTDAGTSPIAAVEIAEGPHDVSVTLAGYRAVRRRIEVRPGEQARVDITLALAGAASVDVEGPAGDEDPGFFREPAASTDITGEWWFWTIIGGGAAVLIAIAIGVGVAVSSSGQPVEPMGIMLPPIEGM
jgi:hypothetical protein